MNDTVAAPRKAGRCPCGVLVDSAHRDGGGPCVHCECHIQPGWFDAAVFDREWS